MLSAGVSYGTVRLTEQTGTQVSYVATGSGSSVGGAATTDLHALLAMTEPAVAAIEVADGTGADVTPIAAGSGVVISADGLMLTNAHVVETTDQAGNALRNPVWPLALGRKSFPPGESVWLQDGLVEGNLKQALVGHPLIAKPLQEHPGRRLRLILEHAHEGAVRLDQPIAPFALRR